MDSRFGEKLIEQTIADYYASQDREHLVRTLEVLRAQADAGTRLIAAVVPVPEPKVISMEAWKNNGHEKRFMLNRLKGKDDTEIAVAFTSPEQQKKGPASAGMLIPLGDLLRTVEKMDKLEGLMINPWGQRFLLTRQTIAVLLGAPQQAAQPQKSQIALDRHDITELNIECIVNAANESLSGGGGVDGAIHRAAGPELDKALEKLGGCATGDAKMTDGFGLKAKHIIHTVGPVYNAQGSDREKEEAASALRSCYVNSLDLARREGIRSIAFPAISTGAYGYPRREAAQIALAAVSSWLQKNSDYIMTVVLSCFDEDNYRTYVDIIEQQKKEAEARQQAGELLRGEEKKRAEEKARQESSDGGPAAPAPEEAAGVKKTVITLHKPAADLVRSAVLGCVTGDALGFPVQFADRQERDQDPVTDMRKTALKDGTEVGLWSDDSSMILAAMDSLNTLKKLNYRDVMDRYFNWRMYGKYTPDGEAFDIGGMTDRAIMNYARGVDPLKCGGTDEQDNGNGSLMRIMPFALLLVRKGHLFEDADRMMIHTASALTHAHPRAKLACEIYAVAVRELIVHGTQVDRTELLQRAVNDVMLFYRADEESGDEDDPGIEAHREVVTDYDEIRTELPAFARLRDIAAFAKLPEEEIRSTGYVTDTLEAAFWCFLTTDDYRSCVLKAVNLGSDTDTVACVAGGLAGIRGGAGSIPAEWVDSLARKEEIEAQCDAFQSLWIS
ncbi:MAG: ADP-ribosylglycohydrolase family protein [Lachnospiraceae bacterium]|jgi:ADP-ribosyl-[dinitrogen reductase] hydrolase|nr:ADP-ribosylglycohydrolase family protein [Lachnospiraceae bacterium]